MPKDINPIMAIFFFNRKRFPDGTLNNYKARLYAHGGQKKWGINYWETYEPVVNWVSVIFILIISQLAGLDTQALVFVFAIPQAELDVPVYMKLPPGIDVANRSKDEYLISLKSSLYGFKKSSANWYDCVKKGLEMCGFTESKYDP